jgi:integrase
VKQPLAPDARSTEQPPSHTKDALKLDDLERIVAAIPEDLNAGRRDRAILLVGIATALRRSDLVALDVGDVQFEPWGMLVSIRKPEASHLASGALAVRSNDNALCAVQALQAWLHGAGIQAGPIFRRVRKGDHITEQRLTDRSVATIVKTRARAAAWPPTRLIVSLATACGRAG